MMEHIFFGKPKESKPYDATKDYLDYILKSERKDMTYIVGAKCLDGVTLVGDKKITIDLGADYTFGNKIFSPIFNTVIGSSGLSGMYKTFQNRMIMGVRQLNRDAEEKKRPIYIYSEDLNYLAEQVIHALGGEYGINVMANSFDALIAMRTSVTAELVRVNYLGLPEPVSEYKAIGHGQPYGSIILKNLWDRNLNMKQFAKLGCFIIKHIQDMNLDSSVGIDLSKDVLPQVWYIPNIVCERNKFGTYPDEEWKEIVSKYPLRELSTSEIKSLMEGVDVYNKDIQNTIKKIKL